MKRLSLAGISVILVSIVACGGSDQADQAAPGQASASQPSAGRVIPHEQLLELLPTIPDWTREGSPQGTTDAEEKVSRVQVGYVPAGPDKASALGIEIMDTGGNPNILAPLREFIKANRTEKSGDGAVIVTTTPTTVLGFPGQQEWSPGTKNGSLSVLVADRFTVGITANYFSDPDIMHQVAERIDLKKLASLK